jgi:hypothetical protein
VVTWEEVRHQVALAGRVIEAQITSQPISGARVEITSAPAAFTDWLALRALQYGDRWAALPERLDRTRTAADGHFHFLDLPNGPYMLTASLPSLGQRYGTVQATVTVVRNAEGAVTLVPLELALPPTTLKGLITDQATGNALLMAEVRVQGSGERTFSDEQGNYLLTGVEPGKRSVLVFAQGYTQATQTVLLDQAGVVQTLNFNLAK